MRIMGLDLGSVTLGVAVSDPTMFLASPVKTLRFAENDYDRARELVLPLLEEYGISKIVLGLPRHMNGDIGESGQKCIRFKEMLEEKTDVPVVLWDERLTTVIAQKELIFQDVSRKKRKEVIDQMAAVQILQSYLDSRKHGEESPGGSA